MGFLIFIIFILILFRPRRRYGWWYRPYHYDMFGPGMHHMDPFGPHGMPPHHGGMGPRGFGGSSRGSGMGRR